MFTRRRKGPWPPPPPEPGWPAYKYTIANINEVVPGGIIRSGKTAWGSGTGFWLGCDPADDESKFDIGTPDDYFRYSETYGVQIKADGEHITNIQGGNITCDNLAAISVNTGALTVTDTLTMGEDGIITWMSGAAKITDDYMDLALTTTNRYAFRFLDDTTVHAYFASYKSANLTQLSIEALGPAIGKYGKISLAATEAATGEPETVDIIIRSDTGVVFSALNYGASRIFQVDTMDVHFRRRVRIGQSATPTARLEVVGQSPDSTILNISGLTTSRGLNIAPTLSAASGALIAIRAVPTISPAGNLTDAYAINTNIYIGGTRSDTITRVYGQYSRLSFIGDFGGRVTNYYGLYVAGLVDYTDDSPACTNYYGVYVLNDPDPTKLYAFYSAVASGTNRWGLYMTGTADNYLNGDLGIKTNAPTAALDINSDILRLRTAKTPASAGAAGNPGDKCWDPNYEYRCVATNTWKRASIATW